MRKTIKKVINTVSVQTDKQNWFNDLLEEFTLSYFQGVFKGYFKEHYDACKRIILSFTNKETPHRHTILFAPTQAGKTTVMTLLYNIINRSRSYLSKILKIGQIIYLTGDNQCEMSDQSEKRFRKHCHMSEPPLRLSGLSPNKLDNFMPSIKDRNKHGNIPFIMIKNSDCKKMKEIKGFSLKNSLIMVDESHYGTKDINSQVNILLHEFGIDYSGDIKKLNKQNIFILSVSATPYNEAYADKVNNVSPLKGMVYYEPGEGYKGFTYFYHNGHIKGLKDNSIITDKKMFTDFVKGQRKKLDDIYDETGVKNVVIMRMQGKKTLLNELGNDGLKKLLNKYGFNLIILDSKRSNIQYEKAYEEMRYSQEPDARNIFVVVKQGFSYGISIPDDVKPYISTVYDFRPSVGNTTTDSTEQGLLGRMTGYYPEGFNNKLEIYINDDHLNGLYNYHIHIPHAESPMPSKYKLEKVRCTFEEWNNAIYEPTKEKSAAEVKKQHIELWNNKKLEPLIFKGDVVDNFFDRHPDFDYARLFSKDKVGSSSTFLTPILEAFNKEVLNGRFDPKLRIDARRQIGNDGASNKIAANLGYRNPIISSASRDKWQNPENADKEGWAFVADITKHNGKKGIEIRIPYGTIGFSKDEQISESKDRKVIVDKSTGYRRIEEFAEEPMFVTVK